MAERIRLYLDEDAQRNSLLRGLRARGVDVLTAHEAQHMGVPDTEQIAFAAQADRTLFTFNRGDFVALHSHYLAIGQPHAGIIVSDQLEVGLVLRRLLRLLSARTAEDMRNWLEFLSNWR